MRARAVLFDVGGPLDLEEASEQLKDACLREALAEGGIQVSNAAFEAACRWAVEVHAPDTYAAILLRLARTERRAAHAHRRFRTLYEERRAGRDLFEPRPGMCELLETLTRWGYRLGLAANQPAEALEALERCGMRRFFSYMDVAGTHGLRKPDPQVFLDAFDALGVGPANCTMVGDRIDNDIAPARSLGMRTVRFRTGRHAAQRPRQEHESPDIEVTSVDQLWSAFTVQP